MASGGASSGTTGSGARALRVTVWAVLAAVACDLGVWIYVTADGRAGLTLQDAAYMGHLGVTALAGAGLLRRRAWARSWVLGWSAAGLVAGVLVGVPIVLVASSALPTASPARAAAVLGTILVVLMRLWCAALPLTRLTRGELRDAFGPWGVTDVAAAGVAVVAFLWPWLK